MKDGVLNVFFSLSLCTKTNYSQDAQPPELKDDDREQDEDYYIILTVSIFSAFMLFKK